MMAKARRQRSQAEDVRMGPLALFTLLTVICLAVLAVLAVSTANASLALTQRRAEATAQLYLDETAAQTFVAAFDEQMSAGADGEAALEAASRAALDSVPIASPYQLKVTTTREDDGSYRAIFDCDNRRTLAIALRYEDGAPRIEEWRMTTVQNDEPAMGTLLGGS